MYKLSFKKNKSKDFDYALKFALELGGSYDGNKVEIIVENHLLFEAYKTMRTLFSYIQNWKSTKAFYNELEVHPYQFILYMNRISECSDSSIIDPKNCLLNDGTLAWSCKKIDVISYKETGSGIYSDNRIYWYNYGNFKGNKWIIDKEVIKKKLIDYSYAKGLHICPFYKEEILISQIRNLPDFIVPDNITFKIHYIEQYVDGVKIQYPNNVRHITNKNFKKTLELN